MSHDVPAIHAHQRLSSADEIRSCGIESYCPAVVAVNGSLIDGEQIYNRLRVPVVVIPKNMCLDGTQVEALPDQDMESGAVVHQRYPRLGGRSTCREPTGRSSVTWRLCIASRWRDRSSMTVQLIMKCVRGLGLQICLEPLWHRLDGPSCPLKALAVCRSHSVRVAAREFTAESPVSV